MRKLSICMFLLSFFILQPIHAQQDQHLREMAGVIKGIRQSNQNNALDNAITKLSSIAKITLMNDAKGTNNEYKGKKSNKFRFNQVVAKVYAGQNTKFENKNEYYNSNEKGIFYSGIEKSIKLGEKCSYSLTGHVGIQEFVFIPFNKKTKFTVEMYVNDKMVGNPITGTDMLTKRIDKAVKANDVIKFSITYPKGNPNTAAFESFVILNHNPQQ